MEKQQKKKETQRPTVKINWDSVPGHVKEDLGATTYHAVVEFLKHPDAQEILDAAKERMIREGRGHLLQSRKGASK